MGGAPKLVEEITKLLYEMEETDLAKLIDHTLLRPDATLSDLEKAVEDYRRFGFATLALSPFHSRIVLERYRGVRVCSVISFPMGFDLGDAKLFLARKLLELGVAELDVVMNIQAFKAGMRSAVLEELRELAELAKSFGAVLKVIIETGLLSDEEKVVAVEIVAESGAHFVKTCTGFLGGRATVHDVALLKRASRGRVKVKASGGIRHALDALLMIAAGADRIGTSVGPRIVEELRELRKLFT